MAIVAGEALLLLAGAAYLVWGLFTQTATEAGAAVVLVLLAAGLAAGLLACARGLFHGRRAARSPVLVWQVLQLPAGLAQFSGGTLWAALVLTVPAVVAIAATFHRDVVGSLER